MQLFISDLHLSQERPDTTRAFLDFLRGPAREAQALWILGDLFEYWVGDDDIGTPFHTEVAQALAALSAQGVALKLISGNRDVLLGKGFAQAVGGELLAEPACIDLYGVATILQHGDALCTDDVAYQQYRAMMRNPATQAHLLAQPLAARYKIAADLRAKSEATKQEKSAEIMDVNALAVAECFRSLGAARMIHGHTHRPARHSLDVDGKACERWVLADWHDQATWLEVSPSGLVAH